MTEPKTEPKKEELPPWVWIVFLLLVFGVLGSLSNRSSDSSSSDPCSEKTLEATYEVGSKYQYRDQASERYQRCMDATLDSYGE